MFLTQFDIKTFSVMCFHFCYLIYAFERFLWATLYYTFRTWIPAGAEQNVQSLWKLKVATFSISFRTQTLQTRCLEHLSIIFQDLDSSGYRTVPTGTRQEQISYRR